VSLGVIERKAKERAANAPSTPSAFGARLNTMAGNGGMRSSPTAASRAMAGMSTPTGASAAAHAAAAAAINSAALSPPSAATVAGVPSTPMVHGGSTDISSSIVTPLMVELRPAISGHNNEEKKIR
jgi:hypothetical protein